MHGFEGAGIPHPENKESHPKTSGAALKVCPVDTILSGFGLKVKEIRYTNKHRIPVWPLCFERMERHMTALDLFLNHPHV